MKSSFDKFLEKNSSIEKKTESDFYELSKLWQDETFICRIPKSTNFSLLENIKLPKELSAIYHEDKKELEFIFSLLDDKEIFLCRTTKFYYKNIEFDTEFSEISDALEILAKGFVEIDVNSETNYRNLRIFRDYFKKDTSEFRKRFFADKTPISFKIRGKFDEIDNDFISFSKHFNVYAKFYDRKAPSILIFENETEKTEFELPCLLDIDVYPESIVMKEIDPVLLDLFQIASDTANIRLKYLFYFQILEYCAYYHLNDEMKRNLNNILKNPDLISNHNKYSRLIIEEFKNNFKNNDDKIKLEKVVSDYCNYSEIEHEIKQNPTFFYEDINFDGGFILTAILKDKSEIENPPKDIMKKIVDRIDNIRNVLVHIRESRENKVILPTKRNHNLLFAYVFLLRRIAEKVAIKFDN